MACDCIDFLDIYTLLIVRVVILITVSIIILNTIRQIKKYK